MKKIVLLILFLYSNLIFSQVNYYLEGQLGKGQIYLNIEENGNDISATYFYRNSLKDIRLEGNKKKDKFNFAFGSDKILEKFELTKLANGNFNGFWINKSGKKTPLSLIPVNFSDFTLTEKIELENKLNIVKLSLIEFKQDSVSKYNGKEFIWYSEKHCKAPFFRLGDNFPEKTKSLINPVLKKIHLENTLSQLNCSSSFDYNKGDGIEYTIKIGFLSPDLLGFQIFSSWFCGGAHPDFGGSGYLIDLNNGKNYDIDDIIAFDKSVTTKEKGGFDAFSKYRSDFFAPKLFEIINKKAHFKKPKADAEEECDYTDLEVWDFISWNFTEKGIEFTPYFARAARICEKPFLVPFSEIRQYKNPAFPYSF